MKTVSRESEWGKVARELEAEELKLQSYDPALLALCGDVKGKRILDYGPGPGILAYALQKMGADVQAFDISEEMRQKCGRKIGVRNVYDSAAKIPKNNYDIIVCNLVLCINDEAETRFIMRNISSELKEDGFALVGFCNPKIFDVPESQLDIRFQTGAGYGDNHVYKKIKKEGFYQILEWHRPVEWYRQVFETSSLRVLDITFTPEYEFQGRKIQDFVILRLEKTGVKE